MRSKITYYRWQDLGRSYGLIFLIFAGNIMSEQPTRNKRLQKKMYLGEWAILGFEFSFKLTEASDEQYELFFNSLEELVNTEELYISLDNNSESFEGSVTSAQRYGNATEEDRAAIEALLNKHSIVSEVKVGGLVDAFYEM
ncbi:MAG: hypothetical protein ACI8UG_002118 [Gammaproteobacteria bacterium]|jgi:uncharacterized protein YggL (DUF469 family)